MNYKPISHHPRDSDINYTPNDQTIWPLWAFWSTAHRHLLLHLRQLFWNPHDWREATEAQAHGRRSRASPARLKPCWRGNGCTLRYGMINMPIVREDCPLFNRKKNKTHRHHIWSKNIPIYIYYIFIYKYTHTYIYILYTFPVQGGKCFSNWWGTCAPRCCNKSINPSPPGYTHGGNLKKGVPKMILPVEMLPKMSFLLDSILNLGGVLPVQNEFYHEFTMNFMDVIPVLLSDHVVTSFLSLTLTLLSSYRLTNRWQGLVPANHTWESQLMSSLFSDYVAIGCTTS